MEPRTKAKEPSMEQQREVPDQVHKRVVELERTRSNDVELERLYDEWGY